MSPERRATARSELSRVLAELQKLPEVDRAALLMRAEDQLPYDEIAQIDVPVMLGLGQHDMGVGMAEAAAQLTGIDKLFQFVLPNAGHNHNAGSNRWGMWQAMLDWADTLE